MIDESRTIQAAYNGFISALGMVTCSLAAMVTDSCFFTLAAAICFGLSLVSLRDMRKAARESDL